MWVTLAEAEVEASVSRSALRSWYRAGEIESVVLDGPHGPQRLVPLDAVLARAERSPRLRRRADREASLENQVAMLLARVEDLEAQVADLRRSRTLG